MVIRDTVKNIKEPESFASVFRHPGLRDSSAGPAVHPRVRADRADAVRQGRPQVHRPDAHRPVQDDRRRRLVSESHSIRPDQTKRTFRVRVCEGFR